LFSVVIPLYNKKQFVSRSIDSVLNQSFTDFEIIVVDDGSTDGGGEYVASQYGTKVKLIQQANQGVSDARNTGIRHASFDYVAFLDGDDIWHRDFLNWMHVILQKYPGAGMLGSTYTKEALPEKIIDPKILEIWDYFKQADENTLFTSSSTVIHRNFFMEQDGFNTNLKIGEDIDVWLRSFDWSGKAYFVQSPLMHYDLTASGAQGSKPDLKQTIFFEMYKEDYPISDRFTSWPSFRDKYLILNLFQYFEKEENYDLGKKLLRLRTNSYPLSQVPYLFPYSFYRFALVRPRLKKLIRNYLKFCFRYLYR
jgi:glycosyltransferase involved in cell wall biosynthesis